MLGSPYTRPTLFGDPASLQAAADVLSADDTRGLIIARKPRGGLAFDASLAYQITGGQALNLGLSDFSVGFIYRAVDWTQGLTLTIATTHSAGPSSVRILLFPTTGAFSVRFYDASSVATDYQLLPDVPLIDNQPYHIVISCSRAGNATLYINSISDRDRNGSGVSVSIAGSSGVNIGNANTNSYGAAFAIDGSIYGLTWFNRALSAADVATFLRLGHPEAADEWATLQVLNSGLFTKGKRYRIVSRTDGSFTSIGAANNTVGTEFLATGTGSGILDSGDTAIQIGCILDLDFDFSNAAISRFIEDRSVNLNHGTTTTTGVEQVNRRPPVVTAAIHLPAKIYAVEGIELNIYFKNIVRASLPNSSLEFFVTCSKGIQYDKFWRLTPVVGDVGTTAFTLSVYYGGILVAEKVTSLVIKAKSVGGGATRKVILIGDSTSASGEPVAEAMRINATAGLQTNLTLSFQGTVAVSVNDSTAVSRATKQEAYNGKSINLFYADVTSPFVFSGVFNFGQYLTNNSITLAANDWILIHLGMNDFFAQLTYTALLTQINTTKTQLDAMIANIQAAVSGIRIGILLTIPDSGQNAFGSYFATSANHASWRFHRNRSAWLERVLSVYDGRQAENIFVFPYNAALDTENNCMVSPSNVAVNAYNTGTTFQVSTNGWHPASIGYFQLGAAFWTYLKAQES